ncbi:hypothetical protein GOODEAATRI_014953 [Goodea atripinnis]|uniref:LIM zinc-binding domain-containing protein n=1 Tax=Goodea atripinnis TaxID=208336 RepID=A0ABV0PNP2_9TELE
MLTRICSVKITPPALFNVVCFVAQSKSEVKKESGVSSPLEAACLCSPPSAKNQCASCGMEIQDRYLLKVNNLNWHLGCLECSVCRASLRQHSSCYVKNKEIFCKLDYFR